MTKSLYPVNLILVDRPVLLVGGGPVASVKILSLVEAGANVTVVAPEISSAVRRLARRCEERAFRESDLDGVHFVVSAAPPEVNREVVEAAHALGLFVLAVDHPAVASVQSPAVLRRGGIQITISTDGLAPALAGLVREALEALLPDDEEAARWIALAQAARDGWKRDEIPHGERRALLVTALQALYAPDRVRA